MRAILLAGGKGTRLQPFTATFPKPLVPLDDVPVIEVLAAQLREHGITDLTVVTGHLAELIRAFLGDGERFGLRIEYFKERTPLDTAGCLGVLPRPTEPFLVMNGDLLTTLNFQSLCGFHLQHRPTATIATYPKKVTIDLGVVEMDDRWPADRLPGEAQPPLFREHGDLLLRAGGLRLRRAGPTGLDAGTDPAAPRRRQGGPLFSRGLLLAGHRPARRLRHGRRRVPPRPLPLPSPTIGRLIYRSRFEIGRRTLARSASEGLGCGPRSRFGKTSFSAARVGPAWWAHTSPEKFAKNGARTSTAG